jgi:hypothetical protein
MRTHTVTDDCTNSASCVQIITVRDTTPPVISCPANFSVQCLSNVPPCPGSLAAFLAAGGTASDNCDSTLTYSCSDGPLVGGICGGTIMRTHTVTDDCTNSASCVQIITVRDTTPPVITCATNKTVECAQEWTFDNPTATDNCHGSVDISIVSTVTNTGPDNTLIATRTWKATDACTNMAFCSQDVTILPCPFIGGCRVTGGSNKETNSYQAPCITTPVPVFVSHGGQVGAPLSVGTPFTPNSPCITGEWQHNRHLHGNNLVGTFHAAGNGKVHQFDSLLCACLPCDENTNAVGVVGSVCNPDDRICGPEPRRAPANKICFSGVGDYTFTNGKKTVKAIFRVDIEDRSEGNSKNSTAPPDRYRIRIWLLDPSCGRNPDPNSAEAMALRLAASADPFKIANLATTEDLKVNIPPDIDDGGDMVQGNHQIHPATGAQCGASVPLPPTRIDIAMEIAHPIPGAALSFGMTAQGYEGVQDPSFIYRITVTNCGTINLTNLSVLETTGNSDKDTSSSYFTPGTTLIAGTAVTRYHTNTWNSDTVQTVTVAGQSAQNGTKVISSSTAMALVDAVTAPRLSIRGAGGGYILEWPVGTPPETVLEVTSSLRPPVTWTVISTVTNSFTVSNAPANQTRFYRLRIP